MIQHDVKTQHQPPDLTETTQQAASRPGGRRAAKRHPRNDLNDLTGREWITFTKSWFICNSRRYHRNRDTELHPARYPEELVAEFLRFFTKRGQWVLDPFCGSGATLVACIEEGRRGVGIELSARYAAITRRRLAALGADGQCHVICADARTVASPSHWVRPDLDLGGLAVDEQTGLPQFDFIMTSPPYWNMLSKSRGGVESPHKRRAKQGLDTVYSQDPHDLGNIEDYDRFIETLGEIFDSCAALLKPGKYLVIVAQNQRVPAGHVVPLAWDLQRRVSRTLSFQGERIWCQDSKQLGIWGYPRTFVPNYHHHYCLIFRK